MKNAAWPTCSNLTINQVLENILKWFTTKKTAISKTFMFTTKAESIYNLLNRFKTSQREQWYDSKLSESSQICPVADW